MLYGARDLIPTWTTLPPSEVIDVHASGDAADTSKAWLAAKRRRLAKKTSQATVMGMHRYSYAASWDAYIDGNVISETSHRYITNLLAATAATKTEDSGDSSEDSDAEQWRNLDMRAGNMDKLQRLCKV